MTWYNENYIPTYIFMEITLKNEERQPQSREDQENIGTSESLMFFYELCNIENNMLALFNKLNDIEYTSGIVNLSKYTLQDPEISV